MNDNRFKIKFYTLYFLMILVLLISSCSKSSSNIIDCKNTKFETQHANDECFYNLAYSTKNVNICNDIYNINRRDICYKNMATLNKDVAVCNIIKSSYEKDNCFHNLGVANTDILICDRIVDQGLKGSCYKTVALQEKDPLICEKIQGFGKDSCYIVLAKETSNIALCEKIWDETIKKECLDNTNIRAQRIEQNQEGDQCHLPSGFICTVTKVQPSKITINVESVFGYDIQLSRMKIKDCELKTIVSLKDQESTTIILDNCHNGNEGERFYSEISLEMVKFDGKKSVGYGKINATIVS